MLAFLSYRLLDQISLWMDVIDCAPTNTPQSFRSQLFHQITQTMIVLKTMETCFCMLKATARWRCWQIYAMWLVRLFLHTPETARMFACTFPLVNLHNWDILGLEWNHYGLVDRERKWLDQFELSGPRYSIAHQFDHAHWRHSEIWHASLVRCHNAGDCLFSYQQRDFIIFSDIHSQCIRIQQRKHLASFVFWVKCCRFSNLMI